MAQYIQTRLSNPSSEAIMARRGTSITPVRVSLSKGSKRRSNPSKRKSNPAKGRRSNPYGSDLKEGLMLKGGAGIGGSLGRQITLTGAGLAGAFLSNYLDAAFNAVADAFSIESPGTRGAVKIATVIGAMTAADAILDRANASEGARVATLVALYAGAGNALANSLEDVGMAPPVMEGTMLPYMRGTMVSSPMLSDQLQKGLSAMGGTNFLPVDGYMKGSLDIPNQPYAAPSHMQGTILPAAGYASLDAMGATAEQGCI